MNTKNIFFNFLLIIFGTLFALLIVEILLRFNNQGPWGNLDNLRNDPSINRPDRKLGWVPKEGEYKFEPFSEEGKSFTINILKDSSRKVEFQKENSNLNELIFLGGSITLGWGINDNQTFTSKLQKKVNKFNIKNYSAGGYGTYQSFLRFENLLKNDNNIKSAVLVYVPNHAVRNIGDEFWLRTLTKFSKRGYVGLPYASINDKDELKRHEPVSYTRTPFMEHSAVANKIAKRIMKFKLRNNEKNKYKVTNLIFSEMKKIADKRNIKFAILNLSDDENAFKPYLNTFKNDKIEHFNCVIKRTKELTIKGDGHPNEIMHSMFSDCIYKNLKNLINIS